MVQLNKEGKRWCLQLLLAKTLAKRPAKVEVTTVELVPCAPIWSKQDQGEARNLNIGTPFINKEMSAVNPANFQDKLTGAGLEHKATGPIWQG